MRTGSSGASGGQRPGRDGRMPAPAAAVLSLVLGAASACGDGGGVDTGRPDRVPERRPVAVRWDTLFRVGGDVSDTVFLQATRIGADAGGVSVVDGFTGRLLRFDTAGRLRWVYGGRGAGPDEFRRPRDLAVDAGGRTWVLDVLNARLTVVEPDGEAAFRVPLDRVDRPADGVAPLGGDRAVLFTLGADAPFVVVDRTGAVAGRWAVPWPGFARLNPLATQMKLAAGGPGGIWGAAFAYGDGFYLFEPNGETAARGWWPEPVPFPGVTVRTSGSPLGRSRRVTKVERPRYGAVSVAMSEDRLFVLFGGEGARANRWIDSYRASDGGYAGSFLLPGPVAGAAYGDGVFYVTYDDPYPVLEAWRPRPAPVAGRP